MSSSSTRAKQRRANLAPEPNSQQPQQQTTTRNGGMTLPQVLQIVDSRITNLEKMAKEQMEKDVQPPAPPKIEIDESWKEILKEYGTRFTMLVSEINDLKDIVMKLQTYTMDVNKTLLEERIHIMGDMSNVKEEIVMVESGTEPIKESNTIPEIVDDESEEKESDEPEEDEDNEQEEEL